LKDEIEEIILIIQKDYKNIAIKRIKIKIEIKINLVFDWRVKLKRKINLTKGPEKKTKRMRMKLIKIIYYKFGLNDETANK